MKTCRIVLIFTLLATMNGCMTHHAIKRAKGEQDGYTGSPASEPNSGYYALLPLTIPADIATSPLQLLLYAALSSGPPL